MESLNDTKDNLDQSIRLLSQHSSQRKAFLRLSGKNATPKRILLQADNQLQKDTDDTGQLNDTYE